MSKIRIKNFGPIKEGYTDDGFMDIKKATVFIGNQGTGKSTVAKLISTLTWLEKAINRGEIKPNGITFRRFEDLCFYQGIKNYILSNTEIEYLGDAYYIKIIKNEIPQVKPAAKSAYVVPQIMYVPAERNFLSTIKDAYNVTNLPMPLFTFAEELKRAQNSLDGKSLQLPINNYRYEYDEYLDSSKVIGDDYDINLLEASSGLQSSVPLFLVSRNLALLINKEDKYGENISVNLSVRRNEEIARVTINENLSESDKKLKIQEILSKYHNECFINIVEEPEQNLFPTSQRHMLNSLLEFANINNGSKLIMTTHSPYIINYLSIAVQGNYLLEKINGSKIQESAREKLNEIIPVASCISSQDVAIYQFKNDGNINLLPDFEGIPSDKNYLNSLLAEGNDLFDSLLEIEQSL